MGGWRLEVGRMVAYIALPIVCFYLFNKPEYFKEYVAKNKQYYLIKEDRESIEKLNNFIKEKEAENEKKLLAQLEAFKAGKK